MDFNFDEFFNNAGKAAQEQIDSLTKVGVPALEVAAQKWGIDTLQQMQKSSQKELNAAVKDVQNRPSTPFGDALKSTVQGTFLQTYGLWIVVGIVVLLFVGMALRK